MEVNQYNSEAGFSRGRNALVLGLAGAVLAAGVTLSAVANEKESTPELAPIADDGTNGNGVEFAYAIASEGSCAPYDHEDGRQAAAGEFDPGIDLIDAEVEFLGDNPDFAKNFAVTGESRNGFMYDALDVQKPSADQDNAGEAIKNLLENEYFVTAPLSETVRVQNTYCNDKGEVIDYRVVDLEKGTYVGGAMVSEEFAAPQGKRVVKLANGRKVEIPENALVVTVDTADGKKSRMLATNKAGISTDDDFESEVGCFNLINRVPEDTPVTTTPRRDRTTTTGRDRTTTTGRDRTTTTHGTTSTTRATTTTAPRTSNTVTQNPTIEGPGAGGEPDNDNNPDNNVVIRTTTTTTQPNQPTTTTTRANSVTSTTLGECGAACE